MQSPHCPPVPTSLIDNEDPFGRAMIDWYRGQVSNLWLIRVGIFWFKHFEKFLKISLLKDPSLNELKIQCWKCAIQRRKLDDERRTVSFLATHHQKIYDRYQLTSRLKAK